MEIEFQTEKDIVDSLNNIKSKIQINQETFTNNSETKFSKFKNFLSLSFLFNKKFKQISKHIIQEDKNNPNSDFEKKASVFLSSGNYEAYVRMLSQGYQATTNQSAAFNKLIVDLFFNRITPDDGYSYDLTKDLNKLESILNTGYALTENNVLEFIKKGKENLFKYRKDFFTTNNVITTHDSQFHYFPLLSENIRNIMNGSGFDDKISQSFLDKISQPEAKITNIVYEFLFLLENCPHLVLKKVSFEKMLNIYEYLQKVNFGETDLLNDIINNYYSKDMNNFLTDTKINYAGKNLENLTIQKIKSDTITLNDLPQEALDVVQSIEVLFNKIKVKKTSNIENLEQLHRMLDKRIPEILGKYLTIDPDYRLILKNPEGLNAQELMLESLNNIYSIFENIYKDINQESVYSLSATNRYVKSLK